MKAAIYAFILAVLIQLPLGYFFISLESLISGHGFIEISKAINFYLIAVLAVASIVTLLIGLPVYFTLSYFGLNTTSNSAIVGLIIPIVIVCVLNLGVTDYEGYSAAENYYGTLRATFEDGTRTLWGWVKFFEQLITYSIHGVLGATLFHKVYVKKYNSRILTLR